MQKIKVMHLMLSLEIGGMENGVVNILRHIRKDIFKNYVCCLERIGALAERIKGCNVSINNMSKKPGFSLSLILKLAKLLRREKIDILHTHCWATLVYGFAAAKIARTPIVIHGEHGIFNLDYTRRRKLYTMIINNIDQILTVSESLKTEIISTIKISNSNVRSIINGVDTDKFSPGDSETIKKKFGFQKTDIIIGSVGRLEKIKNYNALIKCIAMFDEPSIKGLLIGDGPARSELEGLVKDLGIEDRFFFLGKRTDVNKGMLIFDVFVSSSLSEGLSNTILEAMASGIPVVATNVGGNPEIVYEGETGYLVNPNNLEAMKSALERLINDKKFSKSIGQKARELVVRECSLHKMVSEYEDVYLSQYDKRIKSCL